ncbi:hypothetical protein GCL60_06825 [Silvanigrella paludirubra]|uniref:Uncharacterized protein n=1 Tax=Silvanigrella paludirubra TaxID=2499159 RepID=A0A6N6VUG7_9BACT|nr:hypothetical protein [Silvanigrella paludirubra]KAB8039970.1 hypothetical protein GCL60_06825 [Silvanigrella paludirubra]
MSIWIKLDIIDYIIVISIILFLITLPLMHFKVIKNIEDKYNSKIGNSFYGGFKYLNISNYVIFLLIVKKGFIKHREPLIQKPLILKPLILKPLLYKLNYKIDNESKFNIIICILFSLSSFIFLIGILINSYLIGDLKKDFIEFKNSMNLISLIFLYISIFFFTVHLSITPIIKFKILKEIELKYKVIIKNSHSFLYTKYFDVSNYIKDLFYAEKNIFKLKKNNYIMKPNLSEFPYSIKNESKFNIQICFIHAYSLKLFGIFIALSLIGLSLDFISLFGNK